MKRRQVVTGLVAVATAGLFPYAQRQSGLGNELGLAPTFDVPLFDPLSDNENRLNHLPASLSQASASVTSNPVISEPITKETLPELARADELQITQANTNHSKALGKKVQSEQQLKQKKEQQKAINKNIDFAKDYDDDIFVASDDVVTLHSVHLRLKKLQSTIGYGNFNIVSFDEALVYAKRFPAVGEFTPTELQFIEKIYSYDAKGYGFYGDKIETSLTATVHKNSAFKVPYTGHYLFKEQSYQYYEKIRQSVGEGIILTSGIRSNVKQLHLFLAKVVRVHGNLSRASRSLAPSGYSYHGIGDFDVGRKGWGGKNFTDAFSETDEFKRMQDLGYVTIRYDENNRLGVRYEPWHIKVV